MKVVLTNNNYILGAGSADSKHDKNIFNSRDFYLTKTWPPDGLVKNKTMVYFVNECEDNELIVIKKKLETVEINREINYTDNSGLECDVWTFTVTGDWILKDLE